MEKDELIGFWRNGADDSSGLPGIVGYGIEFFADGRRYTRLVSGYCGGRKRAQDHLGKEFRIAPEPLYKSVE